MERNLFIQPFVYDCVPRKHFLVFLFIYSFDKYLLASVVSQVWFQVLRIFLMIKAEKNLKLTFLGKKKHIKKKISVME